jgi:hypothetical protein
VRVSGLPVGRDHRAHRAVCDPDLARRNHGKCPEPRRFC